MPCLGAIQAGWLVPYIRQVCLTDRWDLLSQSFDIILFTGRKHTVLILTEYYVCDQAFGTVKYSAMIRMTDLLLAYLNENDLKRTYYIQ
eukprot:scaffold263779_cov31-Prasinocladus_malaysianus.AAC.1